MGITKDLQFEVLKKEKEIFGFHEVVSVVWGLTTKSLQLGIGAWKDKDAFANSDIPYVNKVSFEGIESFEQLGKILDKLINDPGSLYQGGVKE